MLWDCSSRRTWLQTSSRTSSTTTAPPASGRVVSSSVFPPFLPQAATIRGNSLLRPSLSASLDSPSPRLAPAETKSGHAAACPSSVSLQRSVAISPNLSRPIFLLFASVKLMPGTRYIPAPLRHLILAQYLSASRTTVDMSRDTRPRSKVSCAQSYY